LFFDGTVAGKNVFVAAGPGGNGGGGLSRARHLHNMGATVTVVLTAPLDRLSVETSTQLNTLRANGIQISDADVASLREQDLVIDSILGYSLRGDPEGAAANLVNRINASEVPVLSNDIPTGIEATSGRVGDPAIQATTTLTIAFPKKGLAGPAAKELVGDLYLGNIAVPPELYGRSFPEIGEAVVIANPFEKSDIVRLW
jgi:NAD(P)H-hydrate epimerase